MAESATPAVRLAAELDEFIYQTMLLFRAVQNGRSSSELSAAAESLRQLDARVQSLGVDVARQITLGAQLDGARAEISALDAALCGHVQALSSLDERLQTGRMDAARLLRGPACDYELRQEGDDSPAPQKVTDLLALAQRFTNVSYSPAEMIENQFALVQHPWPTVEAQIVKCSLFAADSLILESLKKQSAQAEPEAVSQAVPSATAGTMLEQFNRIRDMLASGQISAAEADELRRVEMEKRQRVAESRNAPPAVVKPAVASSGPARSNPFARRK